MSNTGRFRHFDKDKADKWHVAAIYKFGDYHTAVFSIATTEHYYHHAMKFPTAISRADNIITNCLHKIKFVENLLAFL